MRWRLWSRGGWHAHVKVGANISRFVMTIWRFNAMCAKTLEDIAFMHKE